jgi:hypothetical protein
LGLVHQREMRARTTGAPVTDEDEQELLRLTGMLKRVAESLGPSTEFREALQKGALALTVTWLRGLRSEVERLYSHPGTTLSEAERAHLRRIGIDPDA